MRNFISAHPASGGVRCRNRVKQCDFGSPPFLAAENVQKSKVMANQIEKQRLSKAPAGTSESPTTVSEPSKRGEPTPSTPKPQTPGTGTQRVTPLEAERASQLANNRQAIQQGKMPSGYAFLAEEDMAGFQADQSYVQMKSLEKGDPSSVTRTSQYVERARQVLTDPQTRAHLQSEGLLDAMEKMVNSHK